MTHSLRHLDLDDKMCQQVNLHVFEHIYPYEQIAEQLSLHPPEGWEPDFL